MRRVEIGFSRPKNYILPVFSWAIRLFEGTPYSHVYIKWQDIRTSSEMVYEASGTRVRLMGLKHFDKIAHTTHTYSFYITDKQVDLLHKFVFDNVGVKYGTKQIIGIALVKLFKLRKNPFSDGRASQVCSETVAYFLRDVMGQSLQFDVDIAGPKAIDNYLKGMELGDPK